MVPTSLGVSEDAVRIFCQKWKVVELDLFGSALGLDFGPGSDVDFLLVYAEDAHPTLFDEGQMQEELEALFGRAVHFMTKRAVESSGNPIRRKAILESATPVYVEST
ncbi:MAG: nucleotidyltransferase [Nitrospiraceae bacterium]|nr:nucleotidyltransferase [Nitrospiraceae bacterium]